MSRDEVLVAISDCARELGRNPTFPELKRRAGVTQHLIRAHFATFSEALRACGLQPAGVGYRVKTLALFQDWAGLARTLGKLPSLAEYIRNGSYNKTCLLRRFGRWRALPGKMRQYAEESGIEADWTDVLAMVREHQQKLTPIKTTAASRAGTLLLSGRPPQHPKTGRAGGPGRPPQHAKTGHAGGPGRPVYAAPLAPAALAHQPVNEAGVLYLFGMLAGRLGYVVTHLQAEFPDCEALREFEPGRWQRIRIEFEFESRNFLVHGHEASECDLVVCWVHNWPECPLEVLELRTAISNWQQAAISNWQQAAISN